MWYRLCDDIRPLGAGEGLEMRQQRQLQIQRHELQHFVDVMQGYITNQLFYLSWRELEDDLATKVGSYPSPSSPLMVPLSVRFTVWMTSSLPTKPSSIKLYFGESYLPLTNCMYPSPPIQLSAE